MANGKTNLGDARAGDAYGMDVLVKRTNRRRVHCGRVSLSSL